MIQPHAKHPKSETKNPFPIAKVVPWVLTLATLVFGIVKFSAEQAQSNRTPFLTKQLDTAFQAAETASSLAVETDPAKWETARQTFWHLYWGVLSIVEDEKVEAAMVAFGKCVPSQPISQVTLPVDDLRVPSYNLAHAIRTLILDSWNAEYLANYSANARRRLCLCPRNLQLTRFKLPLLRRDRRPHKRAALVVSTRFRLKTNRKLHNEPTRPGHFSSLFPCSDRCGWRSGAAPLYGNSSRRTFATPTLGGPMLTLRGSS